MNESLHDVNGWVVGEVLASRAESHGDRICIRFAGGTELTYRDAERLGNQVARLLIDQGVAPGDNVALFMPNGLAFCLAWFGIAKRVP